MNKKEHAQYRKKRLLELHETIQDCYDEINTWQSEERTKRNTDKVSKCYCYDEYDGWQYYLQITSIDKDGNLIGWGFEKDNNDNEVRIYLKLLQQDLSDSYEEIPPEQFWTAWQDIKSELIMLTIKFNKET